MRGGRRGGGWRGGGSRGGGTDDGEVVVCLPAPQFLDGQAKESLVSVGERREHVIACSDRGWI